MNFDNKKYMDDTSAKKVIRLVQDAITTLDEGKANKTNTVNNVQYRVGNSITQSINGTDTTIVYVTDTPTENSNALITAGGVYTALGSKQDTLTFDTEPIENSTNPITSGAVYAALQNIQPSSTPSFTSNVNAISNGFTSGDIGVATQVNE